MSADGWLVAHGVRAGRIVLHVAGVVGLLLLLLALAFLASCSAGPQLPVVTTPITISCVWNNMDGGASEDCDCMVDRSSAQGEGSPTGIRTETGDISPSVSVPISGTGGGAP